MALKYDLYVGDALTVLKTLPDQSVHCCVTSPPYWGLRDYGVDGQLGLEDTPEKFVENMVVVFREVKRVLRDDATLWLNLGDSYATHAAKRSGQFGKEIIKGFDDISTTSFKSKGAKASGLKEKDLIGIPWRVAFALQADGWYLRQDIIWSKPNPMPESVKDRCTKAHEYIFLLSKSQRYYYDYEAIKEPAQPDTLLRYNRGRSDSHKWADGGPGNQTIAKSFTHMKPRGDLQRDKKSPRVTGNLPGRDDGAQSCNHPSQTSRNKRSVWTVSTKPFSGAHFAVFPPELIKPCILAGCPKGGTVLDPFAGSGTTGVVALENERKFIGIELNEKYANEIAKPRLDNVKCQLSLF